MHVSMPGTHTHTHAKTHTISILNSLLPLSPTVLLCILSKPAMNEIFLVLVSYVILGTFLAIEIAVSYAMQPRLVWGGGRDRRGAGTRVSSFSQLLCWSEINHGISCGTLIVSETRIDDNNDERRMDHILGAVEGGV